MKKTASSHRTPDVVASPWWSRSRQLLTAFAVALLVSSPLIASEAVVSKGAHVVLIMAWLLWAALWVLRGLAGGPPYRWRVGVVEGAVVLFLVAHTASALVMLHTGHARPTLNAMWLWITSGVLFFAVRQLFVDPREQRALISALISLSVGLSLFGLYQVGYSNPRSRAQYAQDPAATLRQAGMDAPPGSPQQKQFDDRLASLEPIATFALTNSLAGLLTPNLVLLLYVVGSSRGYTVGRWPAALNGLLPLLVVAGCLLLTKSRSAYGAVFVGVVLLAVSRTVRRRWWSWPVLLAAGCVAVLATAAVVRLGGLDRQVITEAPKSLTYRLQYWRATSAMIADYPWWGCGPGNFKLCYTRYKAAEASETIADPHNFLLEIAATAGVPALLLFLLIGVTFTALLWRPRSGPPIDEGSHGRSSREPDNDLPSTSPMVILAGVVAGFLLAYPAGWAGGGLAPEGAVLWVALPATLCSWWLLRFWVARGSLPRGPLLIALSALLVNLLAAGGISFPGVSQFVWVLAALLANTIPEAGLVGGRPSARHARGHRLRSFVALATAMSLVVACYFTMYRPVLTARQELDAANDALTSRGVRGALTRAIVADRWWAEPWEALAELESRQWIATPSAEQLAAFFAARDGLLARERGSSRVWRQCGDWWLEMFAVSRRTDLGAEAVQAYVMAVELYPHSAILHAQLAWACHLMGDGQRARRHAEEALRLDVLMPHVEFKLARQHVVGGRLAQLGGLAASDHAAGSAEQLMQLVRNVKNR